MKNFHECDQCKYKDEQLSIKDSKIEYYKDLVDTWKGLYKDQKTLTYEYAKWASELLESKNESAI